MKPGNDELINKAKNSLRESKYVEFKSQFDVESKADWCELIKDIVAIANTGGGIILFGVHDNGRPSNYDTSRLAGMDPADVTNKISPYTGTQFDGFYIESIRRKRKVVALFIIEPAKLPIIFSKPGTYPDLDNPSNQKRAFSKGTVYFRHGAKSEPGVNEDLQRFFERIIRVEREDFKKNLREVFDAPPGTTVQVISGEARLTSNPGAPEVRITRDKKAPAFHIESQDDTYKYRQKELIRALNRSINRKTRINNHDIKAIRMVYKIDESKPEFCFKPKFGTRQYSEDFLSWIVESYKRNNSFFEETRKSYRNL